MTRKALKSTNACPLQGTILLSLAILCLGRSVQSASVVGGPLKTTVTNTWNGGFTSLACVLILRDVKDWRVSVHYDDDVNALEMWVETLFENPTKVNTRLYTLDKANFSLTGDNYTCFSFLGNSPTIPQGTVIVEDLTPSQIPTELSDNCCLSGLPFLWHNLNVM